MLAEVLEQWLNSQFHCSDECTAKVSRRSDRTNKRRVHYYLRRDRPPLHKSTDLKKRIQTRQSVLLSPLRRISTRIRLFT